ncbi:MAG: DNRLRE domain-containing protein, partial [Chloroflexota bacterium]
MRAYPRLGRVLLFSVTVLFAMGLTPQPGAARSPTALGKTFSGHVYVGLTAPQGLQGVTVTLYGSTRDAVLGTQLDTALADRAGAFSFTYDGLANYDYFHIVETPLAGYTPVRASPGAGGTQVDATWIRYYLPGDGLHSGNDFYSTVLSTATPTIVPTRTSTATRTRTPTPTATPANTQTLELCASADASIVEDLPGNNINWDQLLVRYWAPDNMRSLLRFTWPTIPYGASVQSATLHLRLVSAAGDPSVQIAVYPAEGGWQETGVTWANQPDTPQVASTQTLVGSAYPAEVTWDVTNLVKEWIPGPRFNYGLVLRGPSVGQWARNFDSSETLTGVCPRLVIVLQSDVAIATLTATSTLTPSITPTPTATPTKTPWCPQEPALGNSFAEATSFSLVNTGTPLVGYICPA